MRDYLRKIAEANRGMSNVIKYIYAAIGALLIAILIKNIVNHLEIVLYIIPFYTAVVFHEVAHGVAANMMGDPTAKIFKRLTLNPIKHIDPIGTLLPVVFILTGMPFVIGWAKPVPVNYRFIKKKPWGIIFVALAGVIANVFNILWAMITLKLFYKREVYIGVINSFMSLGNVQSWDLNSIIILSLFFIIVVNLALAIFNLIPIPPLDGSRVIREFLSEKGKKFMNDAEKYGIIILIGLMYLGVIGKIVLPIFNFFLKIIF